MLYHERFGKEGGGEIVARSGGCFRLITNRLCGRASSPLVLAPLRFKQHFLGYKIKLFHSTWSIGRNFYQGMVLVIVLLIIARRVQSKRQVVKLSDSRSLSRLYCLMNNILNLLHDFHQNSFGTHSRDHLWPDR
jgi:hypothetical protein